MAKRKQQPEQSDNVKLESIDALESESEPENQETQVADAPKASPYVEKSREELEQMLDQKESMIGRQSNEVAEVRRKIEDLETANRYVAGQLNQPVDAKPSSEELDYFGDPAKAIDKSIEDHPALRRTQEDLNRMRAETAAREIETRHPGASSLITTPEFTNFIASSPSRAVSFKSALSQMDISILDELIGAYKTTTQPSPEVEAMKNQSRTESVKQASSGSATGSSEKTGGKIIRRDDVVRLIKTDPERYNRLYPEIKKAYAEGRVK